jgi:hypothetical protein
LNDDENNNIMIYGELSIYLMLFYLNLYKDTKLKELLIIEENENSIHISVNNLIFLKPNIEKINFLLKENIHQDLSLSKENEIKNKYKMCIVDYIQSKENMHNDRISKINYLFYIDDNFSFLTNKDIENKNIQMLSV